MVRDNISPSLGASVQENYELGDVLGVDEIPKPRGALLICTTKGKYLLRPFSKGDVKRLFYADAFTNYLTTKDYPAARTVRTKTGNLLLNLEEHSYYMSTFFESPVIPDSNSCLPDNLVGEAGGCLAQLHLLAFNYQGPTVHRIPFKSEISYKILKRVLQKIETKNTKDEFDGLVVQVIKEKLAHIVRLPFESASFMNLPMIMNHGDFHGGNIVFDAAGHILGVLDFEYCAKMPRIWDIALAMAWLCRIRQTAPFSGEVALSCLAKFLSGYHEIHPLLKDEKTLLNDIYISATFHEVYDLERYYLYDKPFPETQRCQSAEEWFWWVQHRDAIQDVIFKCCNPSG